MARTKTNTQNDTKTRKTSCRNRHLVKKLFLWFLEFSFLFSFFLIIISLMNFPRNVELPLRATVFFIFSFSDVFFQNVRVGGGNKKRIIYHSKLM